LQDNSNIFWPVVTLSVISAATICASIFAYWQYYPNRKHQKRVSDMRALRDLLLYHVDDLEEIMAALQTRSKLVTGTRPCFGLPHDAAAIKAAVCTNVCMCGALVCMDTPRGMSQFKVRAPCARAFVFPQGQVAPPLLAHGPSSFGVLASPFFSQHST
jgi:hypothetical protein